MKRPADINQLGKRIVDLAVGEAEETEPTKRQLNGMALAAKLTPRAAPRTRQKGRSRPLEIVTLCVGGFRRSFN